MLIVFCDFWPGFESEDFRIIPFIKEFLSKHNVLHASDLDAAKIDLELQPTPNLVIYSVFGKCHEKSFSDCILFR